MKLKNLLVLVCSFLLVMNFAAQQNQRELSDTETMFEKNDSSTVQQLQHGLYIGENFQGEMDLYEALDYITINAQEGGEYSIVLKENMAISSNLLDYGGKLITITLKSTSTDTSVQLSYVNRSPSSSLFTVKKGVTFVLENGIELIGTSASRPPVTVDGGTFIMNGGAIRDSKVTQANWFGGGVDILRGGSFVMNNGRISGNSSSKGGAGVSVGENSTFVMNGGVIDKNTIEDGFGGGVLVGKNATFTMYNGEIINNSAGDANGYGGGGGVYVNGLFTMNDGIISKNYCGDSDYGRGKGGGVLISGDGEFVMEGGTISENEGGVYLTRNILSQYVHGTGNGKFTMNGGQISNNIYKHYKSDNYYLLYYSHGVYVDGTFVMNNGIIEKHESRDGGGVYVAEGTFIMNDGSIKENFAHGINGYKYGGGGGGVYVSGGTSFTMNGGLIEKNRAYKDVFGGGGVLVDGKFVMNGGTISGNTTTKSGGGVLVCDNSIFIKSNTAGIIYGGEATDGNANTAKQYGHAVYTKNGSRDSTARATMKLDSTKQGAEGGWE